MEPLPTTTALPAPTPSSDAPVQESYETCDQCNAPVDSTQRYCVVCGAHRKHVYDPAARFISGATSRTRTVSRSARRGDGRHQGPGLGTALVLALIPLAVVLGLLLGNSGNGEDAKLLAALRAQKPEVVNVAGGAGAASSAPSASTPASLSSDFSLARGFAVELGTISGSSTQSAASAAESADRAKGATEVGLISQSDFTVTPAPPSDDYVIYSGQYRTRSAAQGDLAKLKKAFPHAVVVSVVTVGATGSQGAALNTTKYGTFHSVVGIKKPSTTQLNQGAAETRQVAGEINKNYVQSQKGLPNQISVP
ncbi:MAG: zinc ribbon domain-containing protein [Solirubrobacterales bacterium]|nr:zinc ribbon domain-containing protein [Solirubrobacterales bacterium]